MTHEESIKSLLGESVQACEEHSERIEALLDRAKTRFDNDHTGFAASLGAVLIIASVALVVLGRAETFAIVLAVLGGLLFVAALLMRASATERQIKHTETLIALERERARLTTRTNLLKHLWLYERPEGLDFQQIRSLIDETSTSLPSDSRAIVTRE